MENKDNEIKFRLAEQMLMKMLKKGLITDEEYHQISRLNRESFMPKLQSLYS